MKKNLATADTGVKLVLALSVIVCYFTNVIVGPFAHFLMVLAVVVIILYGVKIFLVLTTRD